MTLLATRKLTVEIAGKPICRDLDLDFDAGQCWGILGPNGAGKTTLLHTLAGLRKPRGGSVLLNGRTLENVPRRAIAREIGVVLQDNADLFPASVLETALIGRHPHLRAWQWESTGDRAQACAALAEVDLAGLEDRNVETLSGGERRRLALATVLTQDPRLLLLDEPTNHLDIRHQVGMLDLLSERAHTRGRVLIMCLHDVNHAARYCDRLLLLLGDGETLHGSRDEVLRREHLERLYRHPIVALQGPQGPAFLPG